MSKYIHKHLIFSDGGLAYLPPERTGFELIDTYTAQKQGVIIYPALVNLISAALP